METSKTNIERDRDTFAKKLVCGSRQRLQKRHNQSEQSDQIWAMTTPNTNEEVENWLWRPSCFQNEPKNIPRQDILRLCTHVSVRRYQ